MKLKLKALSLAIIIIVIAIYACRKSSDSQAPAPGINTFDLKTWLHSNGKSLKDETITVTLSNGAPAIGRLDWNRMNLYTINNKKYFYIPLKFSNNDQANFIADKPEGASTKFTLIIRGNNSNTYEAAIRVRINNATLKSAHISEKATLDNFIT